MKASNNGDPRQCAANLLKIARGENPFERIKGICTAIIDTQSNLAQYDTIAEVEWVLETYEPRVEVEDVNISDKEIQSGDLSTIVKIKLREEDEDE